MNMPINSNMPDCEKAPDLKQENEQDSCADERKWVAVFTVPRHERSVVGHLDLRQVESFVPTYMSVHVWKNRQKKKIVNPLFPTYVFAKIHLSERSSILGSPGVVRIVGNSQGPIPIPDAEMEFLRSDFCRERVEPYKDLVVGEKVRIKSGPMQGIQGILMRKKSGLRFVLTLDLINQNAAVEVSAEELEPVGVEVAEGDRVNGSTQFVRKGSLYAAAMPVWVP